MSPETYILIALQIRIGLIVMYLASSPHAICCANAQPSRHVIAIDIYYVTRNRLNATGRFRRFRSIYDNSGRTRHGRPVRDLSAIATVPHPATTNTCRRHHFPIVNLVGRQRTGRSFAINNIQLLFAAGNLLVVIVAIRRRSRKKCVRSRTMPVFL